MVENEAVVSDDKDIAECFNSYFANVVDTFNILPEIIEEYEKSTDPIIDAINKYDRHSSIRKIKDMNGSQEKFEFSNVDPMQISSEIYRLDKTKATRDDIIIIIYYYYSEFLSGYTFQ